MAINRKLKITLAAMIVASQIAGSASVAAPTVDQLLTLQDHLSQGNLGAIVAFVDDNPNMLDNDTPLAGLLSDLVAMVQSGASLSALPPEMIAQLEATLRNARMASVRTSFSAEIY
ncbi:MAG: hypothetical protein RLZZ413_1236 [Pseudomonadota bacterium]